MRIPCRIKTEIDQGLKLRHKTLNYNTLLIFHDYEFFLKVKKKCKQYVIPGNIYGNNYHNYKGLGKLLQFSCIVISILHYR